MDDNLKPRIKQAIVKSLRLTISPDEIQDDIALFGEGFGLDSIKGLRLTISPDEIQDDIALFGESLGLDSIDALELVLELERSFGVVISNEQMGIRVLRSVNSIAQFIEASKQPS